MGNHRERRTSGGIVIPSVAIDLQFRLSRQENLEGVIVSEGGPRRFVQPGRPESNDLRFACTRTDIIELSSVVALSPLSTDYWGLRTGD
jgi:hypothetical protein